MSRTSPTWMAPAVACRGDSERAKDTMKNYALEGVPYFLQPMIVFLVFTLLTPGEKG